MRPPGFPPHQRDNGLGRRIGSTRLARDTERARAGLGAMEGALFGLLGLLIAFTFSGAASRFDSRRQLIAEEANAIGTAWLRLALLAPDQQAPLRESFRDYLDSRLLTYRKLPDFVIIDIEYPRTGTIQLKEADASLIQVRQNMD